MKGDVTTRRPRDILHNWWTAATVFLLPALALVVIGFFDIGQGWRAAFWAAALTVMGTACVVNAFRCGRVHCYLTGPFFLIMAILALLYGFGVVALGKDGWNILGLTVVMGALILSWLPEKLFGKYRLT